MNETSLTHDATTTMVLTLETVARLDRDLSVALGHADMLAAHTTADARMLWELRRVLEQSVCATRGLRESLLVAADDTPAEHLELIIRERTAAVTARLTELASNEHEVLAEAQRLYTGRFRSLVDVNSYVIDRIGLVNLACFHARLAAQDRGPDGESELARRRAIYQAALLAAKRSFDALGRDPAIASFLRMGATVASAPFAKASSALALLLGIGVEERGV